MTAAAPPLLDARGITKRFAGIQALDRIDLVVEPGEMVGLIGPNGAGKTTLFNCLYGLLRPDAGRVYFAGQDVTGLPTHRRARLGIARTFQRMELFTGMSVLDHLIVAAQPATSRLSVLTDLMTRGRPPAEVHDRAVEILAMLGLQTVADRPIEALTLGQGRLVELGRALMTEPRLLFLDEPSSGLDRLETAEVAAVLVRARRERGVTFVLVEHDLNLVRDVTERLHVLDYGTVIASGPTREVLDDPVVREAYLGTPV
ncbi:ABC transporter ATP-binding protein [Rhabdothermincola sediminis]|uniref:ABC transporter ATP-binding protein n=1 Tax=Rhabdothermincola sediminis TaxID=2751370 RepID=UPI001AA0AD75|nr:ABC transporter ATP-binding protein [Rhabdothermincola sediminis]